MALGEVPISAQANGALQQVLGAASDSRELSEELR